MFKLILFGLFVILAVPFISGGNLTDATLKTKNITEFFPDAKGNLTKITWTHAVNSQVVLKDALNSTVMMLEADVVLGKLTGGDSTDIPIMAHPPNTTSDLSLDSFLKNVQDFNANETNTAKKGIKLDFKTIEVFEASLSIVKGLYSKMDYPVWLNADILPGPLNATEKPVDAKRFMKAAQDFENATLSLGWTTHYGANITNTSYTDEQINQMLTVLRESNVSNPITFPVRAGIAAQSLCQLGEMVTNLTDSTVTLWNGAGDHVDIEPLRTLIAEVGVDRVYIDLPDELKNRLRLDQLSGASIAKPFAVTSAVLAGLLAVF